MLSRLTLPSRGDLEESPRRLDLGPALTALWLAVVFVLSAAAVRTAPHGSGVAVWWPAAGAAAALLLLSPPRRWVALALMLVPVTGLANAVAGRPPPVAALFGCANAVEALVLVLIFTAAGRRSPRMRELGDVSGLVLAVTVASALLGLMGAATLTWLADGAFWGTVQAATASHAASHLVMLPLVLLAADEWQHPRRRSRLRQSGVTRLEALAQAAVTVAAVGAFLGPSGTRPVAFLVFPAFVWAALRLTTFGAMLEVGVTAVVCEVLAADDKGPFAYLAPDAASAQALGSVLQAFIIVLVLVTLTLSLASNQLRHTLMQSERDRDFIGSVLDTTSALLLVLDQDGKVIRVNAATERNSGLSEAQLLGRPPWETVLPSSARPVVRGAMLSRGGRDLVELEWVAAVGPPQRVVWTTARLAGEGEHLLMTGIDVTARRRSEGLLRTVLDAATSTAILGASPDGTITFVNRGAEMMLGRSAERLVAGCRWTQLHDPLELVEQARVLGAEPGFEVIVDGSGVGEPSRRDWTWIRGDGSTLTVSLTVTPICEGERVIGYVGVAEDVTDRHLRETALREALEIQDRAVQRLREVSQMKSDLVASVSHELRTPLTSLITVAHLLRSERHGPLTERQEQLVARLDRNGRRLLSMIEDLLVLAALESERRPERQPLDLRDVVAAVAEFAEELLEPRTLELVVELPEVPCPAWGNRSQLERALLNLVANAVKFTPDGGRITVGAGIVDAATSMVRVADTGVGIDEADLQSVFEPFFRSTSPAVGHVPGSGLGLAIVADIASAHGGQVTCSSRRGEGTEVRLTLPATAWDEDQPSPTSDATSASSRGGSNGLTT